MTVTSPLSKQIFVLNGAQTVFAFGFVAANASWIQVTYTDITGNVTVLSPTAYTLAINPAVTGALWGVGGTVTYAPGGSPAASGTLTVARIAPYQQNTSISNQTALLQSVIEQAMDGYYGEVIQGTALNNWKLRQWQPGGTEYAAGAYGAPFTNATPAKQWLKVQLQRFDR